jgi:hypothetical protein
MAGGGADHRRGQIRACGLTDGRRWGSPPERHLRPCARAPQHNGGGIPSKGKGASSGGAPPVRDSTAGGAPSRPRHYRRWRPLQPFTPLAAAPFTNGSLPPEIDFFMVRLEIPYLRCAIFGIWDWSKDWLTGWPVRQIWDGRKDQSHLFILFCKWLYFFLTPGWGFFLSKNI